MLNEGRTTRGAALRVGGRQLKNKTEDARRLCGWSIFSLTARAGIK